MKALVVDAEWAPRKGHPLTEKEKTSRKVEMGSQVWRNPTFDIKEIPTPGIKDDEVLIRVKVCGICGSDTHLYETDKDGYIIFSGLTKMPCTIGHEFAGVVEKTGKAVIDLKPGDQVAVESVMWCGLCHSCRSGTPNQCLNIDLMGLSCNGSLAEYIAVKERYCWNINELSNIYAGEEVFEIGALVEPIGCAYNGMFINGGGFYPGAVVVVYGCGPIGLGAIALARISGACKIIAFDVIDERVKIAKELGADYAFNSRNLNKGDSSSDLVMELTGGWGGDMMIEAAGAAPCTIPEMIKSLANKGKIIYLGRAATETLMPLDSLMSRANKIIGARGHAGYGIFPYLIKLLASGRLDVSHMVTNRFPFERVLDALACSSERTDGKIMVLL